jgi:diguanylate cyclase (GGDEF)-like protein
MDGSKNCLLSQEKTDADLHTGLLAGDALPLDLVSAYAGDRPLTPSEIIVMEELKINRGGQFFSDLLHTITHQDFSAEMAEDMWNHILRHKYEMSFLMSRNIRIAVATLDYLSNLTEKIHSATVIDETQIADIVRQAQCDSLTGLYNHAYCYQKINMEIARYTRYGTMVSVMMIDIDDFKEINDRWGHQEGDRILVLLAKIIQGEVRDSDVCCRYGGEEFLLVLPSIGAQEAGLLAERLRIKLAQNLPFDRSVTVSIGVAESGENTNTALSLVEKADTAMYQAKKKGKNQVVISV